MTTVIDHMTKKDGFICSLAGGRFIGGVNGRSMRRATKRKRRLEAKKQAKLNKEEKGA